MAGQRQTQPKRFDLPPGIFTEATDSGAERWKDGDMVRFTKRYPEKIGGSLRTTLTFADGVSTEIMGHVRAILDWVTFDGQKVVAIGTECKLYLIHDLTVYDITPTRRQANLSDPFTTEADSARVTVTDEGFGAEIGDHVRFRDAVAVGGITIDGEYRVDEVIDENTYIIVHSQAASSGATGGGNVVIQYDISCGLADDGTILTGFGTGDFGMEDYGNSMDETSTYTGNARVWSLDKFGEDLLASPKGESLFWWDATNGFNSRAVRVPGAPENIQRFVMSANERYAILLGTNEVVSGNQDKMLLRWSDTDDFGNYEPALTPTDESFAGFRRPNVGSEMIAGIRTETMVAVWSDRAMYRMLDAGEPRTFEVEQIGEEVRIMGPNCAVEVDGVIFFMGRDNFHLYDSALRILECDIWSYVFRDVNRSQASKFYAWVNTNFSEVWFHYCSEGSNECDRVAIFNYRLRCWYYNTMHREAGHGMGAFGYPYAFLEGEIYLHENGYDDGDEESPMWSWIESYDVEMAEGAFHIETSDYEPDMDELVGTLDVYLRAKERMSSVDVVEDGPFAITPWTDILHPRVRGSLVAVAMESNDPGDFWRCGAPRIRFGPHGRR